MSATRRVPTTLALCLALLTAGCAGSVPGFGSASDPVFEEPGLDSLRTTEPTCGDPSSNVSSYSRPVPGGRKLSVEADLPVRSRGTELEASFEELGPGRFELAVERTNGSGVPECYLETRYNATVNLTDAVTDRYTLVVTYDGVLVAVYFGDPDGSGAGHGLAPETRHAPWVRNVTDGRDGTDPAGGGAADGGGAGSGGAGGGAAGGGSG